MTATGQAAYDRVLTEAKKGQDGSAWIRPRSLV